MNAFTLILAIGAAAIGISGVMAKAVPKPGLGCLFSNQDNQQDQRKCRRGDDTISKRQEQETFKWEVPVASDQPGKSFRSSLYTLQRKKCLVMRRLP